MSYEWLFWFCFGLVELIKKFLVSVIVDGNFDFCVFINKRIWLYWCVYILFVLGGSVVKLCYGCYVFYS